jgi:CheY-like chemotaxis protein
VAKRVLLVDDEQDFLDIMGAWLQFKGYDVTTARDGIEGMEKLRDGIFDIILLDLMMPRMDGFDFCRHVKNDEHYHRIPILVLTAAIIGNAHDEQVSIGADALLEKLIDHSELEVTIQKLLAAKHCCCHVSLNNALH